MNHQNLSAGEGKPRETDHVSGWHQLWNFRLKLGDLFVFAIFCAGLSLIGRNSWTLPFTTLLAISLSLPIGFFFVVAGLRQRNTLRMLVWFCISGVLLGIFGSGALFLVALAHAVGAILFYFAPAKFRTPRLLMRSSMALIVIALSCWTSATPHHLDRLLAVRIDYPIEDISMRLDYEHPASDVPQEFNLAAKVESRLDTHALGSQKNNAYHGRATELERVHSEKYERFVRQLGFGVIRMRGVGHSIATPDLPSIDFDSAMTAEMNQNWRWILYPNSDPSPVELGNINELANLHFASENDFLNSNMFGFVAKTLPEKVHAAGFVPHAFHDGLEVVKSGELESLQLTKLELVSLLKFDKPKAYGLDHLPRMNELSEKGITTRELTQFESNALNQLHADENVVIEQTGDAILMMGSLRAATHCLDCHSGARGKLLGAFSYEFTTKN